MFVKIPFESIIPFKTNIYEITKMSLEHDFNVNDGVVLGNFYVSGEYKSHEVSVNKDEFRYTLPFTVELNNRIDKDTIEFNIEDFSYEVMENNKLKVNIEYSLEAEEVKEREELFEKVDEEKLEEEIENITREPIEEKEKEGEKMEEEERIGVEEEKTIMDSIKGEDDTFVTYHIHIVKESETYESISNLYNTPLAVIKEYNNMEELTLGDKVLIPKCDE